MTEQYSKWISPQICICSKYFGTKKTKGHYLLFPKRRVLIVRSKGSIKTIKHLTAPLTWNSTWKIFLLNNLY